jgi:hypothetical protein
VIRTVSIRAVVLAGSRVVPVAVVVEEVMTGFGNKVSCGLFVVTYRKGCFCKDSNN